MADLTTRGEITYGTEVMFCLKTLPLSLPCADAYFLRTNFDLSFFEGMAAANGYSIAYSAYIVGSGSLKQYFIPASKELLAKLDLNRVDYVGITYIFRKTSDKDFKFYYQGNADKPRELFKVDLLPDRLPAERLYIPIQQADTLKTISFKNLVVELMMRIWGKAKFWA